MPVDAHGYVHSATQDILKFSTPTTWKLPTTTTDQILNAHRPLSWRAPDNVGGKVTELSPVGDLLTPATDQSIAATLDHGVGDTAQLVQQQLLQLPLATELLATDQGWRAPRLTPLK